ncbi:MAG: hypothetical protein O7E57_15945 [Gammaproteobacteria bacterium]|nr:hypothetical protein [Gammaproteobacteria bacterium]
MADEEVVEPGASITLTWTVRNADSCSATGGWSGDRAASGSEIVGPLSVNTTYKLTCSGVGGNALVMITVFVNGVVQLSWIAPTENMDGSNLNDLVGYKIYYGVQSRGYVDSVRVNGSNVTQYELNIPMGTYYVAMTAMDAEGNESMFSNELVKDSI